MVFGEVLIKGLASTLQPTADMMAALFLCGLLCGAVQADDGGAQYDLESQQPGEGAAVELPAEFDVVATNRLYLYGERVQLVRLTLDPGDSLRLNGIPIYPRRVPAPDIAQIPKAQLRRIYGDVPYVQRLVADGAGLGDAVPLFVEERLRVLGLLHAAYQEARECAKPPEEAVQVVLEKLHDIDTSHLLDWDRGPTVVGTGIRLAWKGMDSAGLIELEDDSSCTGEMFPTEPDMLVRATMIYEAMVLKDRCWCIIGSGGFRLLCGRDISERLEAELLHLRSTGDISVAPALGENTARDILRAEGR